MFFSASIDSDIEIDVPGLDKKDINIECKDGYLTVSVKKEEKQESDNKNYIIKLYLHILRLV